MESSFYVSLSGQVALHRRMDTIANNVANSTTAGFRAENVTFESLVSQSGRTSIAFASRGDGTFSHNSGPLVQTGNPFDVAVQGDGFLGISTPSGIVYTRDGRMRMSSGGELQTMAGQPILDVSGAPVQVDPNRGPIVIARNGTISQNGDRVGSIGLFRIPPNATLSRYEGAGFIPDRPAEPLVDFNESGFVQGYFENANVNPVLEMTKLISVTRAFEALASSIEQSDRDMSDAIRTLGNGRGG